MAKYFITEYQLAMLDLIRENLGITDEEVESRAKEIASFDSDDSGYFFNLFRRKKK